MGTTEDRRRDGFSAKDALKEAVPYRPLPDPGAFPGYDFLDPEAIRFAQHVLNLPETGEYAEETVRAVARLQWEYRLPVGIERLDQADGLLGPRTWRVLRAINRARDADVTIAGHNLNWLLSDGEFRGGDALSLDQVRRFLTAHDSILATSEFPVWLLGCEDPGVPGSYQVEYHGRTYWKYPSGRTVDPARVISEAALACGISPLVLLTMLQKESSLVTSRQAGERMDERWLSTIFGMGFAVPNGGEIDASRTGLDVQIAEAARRSAEMYEREAPAAYPHVCCDLNYGADEDIVLEDGTLVPWAVEVRNRATWVLYRCTPHVTDTAYISGPSGGNCLFAEIYARFKADAAAL